MDTRKSFLVAIGFALFVAAPSLAAELTADSDTLLLLHFNNDPNGVGGETPLSSTGLSYQAGLDGQALQPLAAADLRYDTTNNVNTAAGTIEFWINLDMPSNTGQTRTFLQVGSSFTPGILMSLDGANNLRFIQWGDDRQTPAVETAYERSLAFQVGNNPTLPVLPYWSAGTWHHIAATWDVAGTMRFYIDGQLEATESNAPLIGAFSTPELRIGTDFAGNLFTEGLIEELRISSRPRTASEVEASFLLGQGITIAPVGQVQCFAGNQAVEVLWSQWGFPALFSEYRVYRDTVPFNDVAGMTPITTIPVLGTTTYVDTAVTNGTAYYYAVTAVNTSGIESSFAASVGPRTPFMESDLQVVCIARTPRYERYDPTYTTFFVTDPSGFGPYECTAATGLGSGQTPTTQRFPAIGDTVTYTATVRNRGSIAWQTAATGTWRKDGVVLATVSLTVPLEPGEQALASVATTWDGNSHEIEFEINVVDDRPENNLRSIDARSVAFLSFVDRTYLEDFRETTASFPNGATNDFIDWLQRHMDRFNELFALAGTDKRVHFDVLDVLDDFDVTPAHVGLQFAKFPERYLAGGANFRVVSAYYDAVDDYDYGLLHEMGHQLGLIDLYRINLDQPSLNEVNQEAYLTAPALMHGVSQFVSEHSAAAMTQWYDVAHGYYGQYLYRLPQAVEMRFFDSIGQPLVGANVTMYQKVKRDQQPEKISPQIKAQGATGVTGEWVLPNVPIDPLLVPPALTGDTLGPNPFGYLSIIGNNGLLLFEVEFNGNVDYAWLDVTEVNNAFHQGQTVTATFDRTLQLVVPQPEFVRGDCNQDGSTNIADPIKLLSFLFPVGPVTLDCATACDANDDDGLNIADAVRLLSALFDTPAVPLPGPLTCGQDPTLGVLSCAAPPSFCP
ncbi:MAG: LamG-like jellyroll fold domain-containing protein [Planctomycetota bacterium]